MFPRNRRLRHRRDIVALLQCGRLFQAPHLTLRVRPTTLTRPRATVVVGTRVSKRATVRNRLKRQLRALLVTEFIGLARGIDVMVSARVSSVHASRDELRAALHALLRRAGLFR